MGSFTCVMWLIHLCVPPLRKRAWHDLFICVIWPMYMLDMTHLHVWHDSSICVTWLIDMHDMTHLYTWNDLFARLTWLMHVRHTRTHSCMWQDSFIYVILSLYTWNVCTCLYVYMYIHVCIFIYVIQGDALSCRSFFAKAPLIIGLFCGKWLVKIRHPMGLRHPVLSLYTWDVCTYIYVHTCLYIYTYNTCIYQYL